MLEYSLVGIIFYNEMDVFAFDVLLSLYFYLLCMYGL